MSEQQVSGPKVKESRQKQRLLMPPTVRNTQPWRAQQGESMLRRLGHTVTTSLTVGYYGIRVGILTDPIVNLFAAVFMPSDGIDMQNSTKSE